MIDRDADAIRRVTTANDFANPSLHRYKLSLVNEINARFCLNLSIHLPDIRLTSAGNSQRKLNHPIIALQISSSAAGFTSQVIIKPFVEARITSGERPGVDVGLHAFTNSQHKALIPPDQALQGSPACSRYAG